MLFFIFVEFLHEKFSYKWLSMGNTLVCVDKYFWKATLTLATELLFENLKNNVGSIETLTE